jgi:ABC-type transport system involved in multi-copper enzyme maturation permease subunit
VQQCLAIRKGQAFFIVLLNLAMNAFAGNDGDLQSFVKILLLAAPALIGMFWGAPLIAREFETGTFRLAWTQDVTPTG